MIGPSLEKKPHKPQLPLANDSQGVHQGLNLHTAFFNLHRTASESSTLN